MRISDGSSDVCSSDLLTGTLEKYPKMRVMFVEPGRGWLPWCFESLLDPRMHQHYTFSGVKRPPSETFRQQCGATFMYEPRGLADCYKYFGPDCLYWSTDFPHPATCWPNSRSQVVSQFKEAGIPEADRIKIKSEEHTAELQSLMRSSYAVVCL